MNTLINLLLVYGVEMRIRPWPEGELDMVVVEFYKDDQSTNSLIKVNDYSDIYNECEFYDRIIRLLRRFVKRFDRDV